jgi:tetratricopeptide (TPR) repeat protein
VASLKSNFLSVCCKARALSFLRASLLICYVAACIAASAWPQTTEAPRVAGKPQASTKKATPAEAELRKRLDAAEAAKRGGSPAAVAEANAALIALTLRELGQLRLIEGAFPQASEIYLRALDFEDVPDARVDLAIAELDGNRPTEAIAEAEKALEKDPNNVRALKVEGLALVKKQEFARAAEMLSRAVDLEGTADLETEYSLGMCYLQSRDAAQKQKADAVFARMVQTEGDSGSLHVLFGRAYRDGGEMPKAAGEFRRAIALDPRTPHAHYFLGLVQLAINEWKATPEVRAEFTKELEIYPKDYLANYLMGFLTAEDRDYAVSDKYLNAAISVNPDGPEPWLYLGLNAYAREDMKTAEEDFRKAVVLTGSDEARSNYQIRRAYVDLGRILLNSGRAEESEVFLAKARDLQKKTMELTQQGVASSMAEAGGTMAALMPVQSQKDLESSASATENADPFAPVDTSITAHSRLTKEQRAAAESQEKTFRAVLGLAFNDLATSEAVGGEYLAALGHYQEAERWDGQVPGLAKNLGLSAFRAKNYPEAIRGFSKALEEKPGDSPVRALLGMAYFGAEKFGEAAKTFAPLDVRGMQDSSVGYAWATSLARSNEPKRAAEVLGEFEKTNHSADALLQIGQLWIEIGDYARAVETLHSALQEDAALRKAHYFAGQADVRWGHWADAATEFKSELAMTPDDLDARYNLGFVYLQQSRVDDAVGLFQQVIAARPEYANAQYQIGKILLDRGQVEEAVTHLEAATRLSPQTDYMHYQLQAAYRKESRDADADRELEIYKELKAKQRIHDREAIPLVQSP